MVVITFITNLLYTNFSNPLNSEPVYAPSVTVLLWRYSKGVLIQRGVGANPPSIPLQYYLPISLYFIRRVYQRRGASNSRVSDAT